ncbi:MAG: DUF309 domain-containing protein [Gaiellaceae bacterium]
MALFGDARGLLARHADAAARPGRFGHLLRRGPGQARVHSRRRSLHTQLRRVRTGVSGRGDLPRGRPSGQVGAVREDQLRVRRGLRRHQSAHRAIRNRAQRPEPPTRDLKTPFERGLELAHEGRYFEAHEELELAWRAAEAAERDFFQGLVHVVVAWYQASRGNRTGCERQLEKAGRRLAPYAPAHRGVHVDALLSDVERARARVAAGSLELAPLRVTLPRFPGTSGKPD